MVPFTFSGLPYGYGGCSLHCSDRFLELPSRILTEKLVKAKRNYNGEDPESIFETPNEFELRCACFGLVFPCMKGYRTQ